MGPFENAKEVEARSLAILEPLIEIRHRRYVLTHKGRLSKEFQERYGDVFYNLKNGDLIAVELKAEEDCRHDNFFLEEWSNRHRNNPGWMRKLDVDLLFYHFLADDDLYIIPWPQLQQWAGGTSRNGQARRIEDFPLKEQTRREQMNDTWGYCVPIAEIREEMAIRLLHPEVELGLRERGQSGFEWQTEPDLYD